jgi:hypothetical protein
MNNIITKPTSLANELNQAMEATARRLPDALANMAETLDRITSHDWTYVDSGLLREAETLRINLQAAYETGILADLLDLDLILRAFRVLAPLERLFDDDICHREYIDQLPEVVTLYRGGFDSIDEAKSSLAWQPGKSTAEQEQRLEGSGILVSVKVRKEDILAILESRFAWIIDPERLFDVREETEEQPE